MQKEWEKAANVFHPYSCPCFLVSFSNIVLQVFGVCFQDFKNHLFPQDNWEIVEGLRGGFGNVVEPQKQEGYMLKKRKWPMKGWHKVMMSSA